MKARAESAAAALSGAPWSGAPWSGHRGRGTTVGGLSGYAGEFGHARVSASSKTDSAGIARTRKSEVTRRDLLDFLGLVRADADELERGLLTSGSPAFAPK